MRTTGDGTRAADGGALAEAAVIPISCGEESVRAVGGFDAGRFCADLDAEINQRADD